MHKEGHTRLRGAMDRLWGTMHPRRPSITLAKQTRYSGLASAPLGTSLIKDWRVCQTRRDLTSLLTRSKLPKGSATEDGTCYPKHTTISLSRHAASERNSVD